MPVAAPIAGGLAAGAATALLSKSSGGNTVQTQQSSEPWWAAQPHLANIFARAQTQSNAPQLAGQSPYTLEALQRQAQSTLNPDSLTNQGIGQFGKTIQGDYLSADSNPYLKGAVDKAMNDVQGRVNSVYGRGGGNNFGSTAHQEWLGRSLADTALPIYAANYQQERGRQLNAAQLAPGMEAQGYAGLTGAGGAQDAYSQAQVDSPWLALQRYQQAISGAGGGQSTATQPYYPANPLLNGLGTGISAAGLFRQLAGNVSPNAGSGSYTLAGNFAPQYSGYDATGGGPAYG